MHMARRRNKALLGLPKAGPQSSMEEADGSSELAAGSEKIAASPDLADPVAPKNIFSIDDVYQLDSEDEFGSEKLRRDFYQHFSGKIPEDAPPFDGAPVEFSIYQFWKMYQNLTFQSFLERQTLIKGNKATKWYLKVLFFFLLQRLIKTFGQ